MTWHDMGTVRSAVKAVIRGRAVARDTGNKMNETATGRAEQILPLCEKTSE